MKNTIYNNTFLDHYKLKDIKDIEQLNTYKKENFQKNAIVMVLNIKDFSLINYRYGNIVANSLLEELVAKMNEHLNMCDLFRIQSDEFLIIYIVNDSNLNDKRIIKSIKRDIKRYIALNTYTKEEIQIDLWIGISVGKIGSNLLRKAKIALKYTKLYNKKNLLFSRKILNDLKKRVIEQEIARKLKDAYYKKQVVPHYQVIIDNKTMKASKYEALARIIYDNEIIMPNDFLDVSKEINIYDDISREIISKVFEDVYVNKFINSSNVNISIIDIENIKTSKLIESLLKEHGGDKITFEIVEKSGVKNYEIIKRFVAMVKKYDAKVAIDDFGTGHSGYEHLMNLDVDYIKIDGVFVKQVVHNIKAQLLIKSICIYAKEFNIKVVAEFVENEDIFNMLKSLGVDYSQGYYFGKPEEIKGIK
jgi:EAL domain-containing protein (putative c-di-GMP-specific phosphodiesterase class I)/GGDEF domain-containing protein